MSFKIDFRLTVLSVSVTVCAVALSACGNSKWREVVSRTGDPIADQQVVQNPQPLQPNQTVHVLSDRLPGRTNPDQPDDENTVVLDRNDRLRVTDPAPRGHEGYTQVVVVDTRAPNVPATPILVPTRHIQPEAVIPTNDQNDADRYFMIQNIATEKVRVYETCGLSRTPVCKHKMILETDMTAGEDTPTRSKRTLLGSYRITNWFKFYQDSAGLFPSWYAPNLPELPAAGAGIRTWMSPSLLPNGRDGVMRGSFGWYAAHIQPSSDSQWTHGTFGWGADGDRFIQMTRDPQLNIDMDPRSQGCTRVENQAIAFMREILPRGTKLIKIYAREAYRDRARAAYRNQRPARWSWILTKEGVNSAEAPKSSRRSVEARRVAAGDILERGTYVLDQMPDAVPFRSQGDARTERTGNLYQIPEAAFNGAFVVDEGTLVDYRHPQGLRVGGHPDRRIPNIMVSGDQFVTYPRVTSGAQPAARPATPAARPSARPATTTPAARPAAPRFTPPAASPSAPATTPVTAPAANAPTASSAQDNDGASDVEEPAEGDQDAD